MLEINARPFIMLREKYSFTFVHISRLPVVALLSLMTFEYANIKPSSRNENLMTEKGSGSSFLIHSIVVKCGKRNSLFYLEDVFCSLLEGLIVSTTLASQRHKCSISSNVRYSFVLLCNLHSMSTRNKIKIVSAFQQTRGRMKIFLF